MQFFKHEIIGQKENPYMIRFTIFQCKSFQVLLHKFLTPDDDCLHDHPWNFITFIIKGGYFERVFNDNTGKEDTFYRKPGYLGRYKAEHRHAVLLKLDSSDKYIPAYTFVITFKKRRMWGFWINNTFVRWFDYLRGNHKC